MASLPLSRRTAILGGLGVLVVLAVVLGGRSPDAAARLRVPGDPAEVLETVPGTADPRAREVAQLRRTLAANPKDLPAAVSLARLEIRLARDEADPRWLGQAQAALAPWWTEDAPPAVLVLRATIEQSLHDFEAALRHLDRALGAAPDDPQAWLTRAVILTVRAQYDDARASCGHVGPLAGTLAATVCDTQIDSLNGRAAAAYARLKGTLEEARTPEEREWAIASLGEYAMRYGDAKTAEEHLREAITLAPSDAYARAALADVLLDVGRNADAVKLLEGHETDDALLLRLTIAEHRMRTPKGEAHQELLAARYAASHARGDVVHRREEARFLLEVMNDPKGALPLAKANWEVQKEPWDARVLLSAAIRAEEPAAAAPVVALLAETHYEDPNLAELATRAGGAK